MTAPLPTLESPELLAGQSLGAAPCSVTPNALIVAFVQGAQWWEHHKTGATMWASDRNEAEAAACFKAMDGTLGESPNNRICDT